MTRFAEALRDDTAERRVRVFGRVDAAIRPTSAIFGKRFAQRVDLLAAQVYCLIGDANDRIRVKNQSPSKSIKGLK